MEKFKRFIGLMYESQFAGKLTDEKCKEIKVANMLYWAQYIYQFL